MQDVVEAPALLADAVGDRHFEPVDEQLFESTALRPIFGDLADLDLAAVEIGVEQGHAVATAARTSSTGVVRASISILLATCAVEIQILWPDTT